ncbi:TetR/AcrR family transcriptional regulator [Streptomyces sp. NPDC092296]|uniref:TetR/AcrR family transcriptional regulator n=1 Tax=Streptomyces sp. NPDC092296 TaxID=3366012 RepID=UPI00381F7D47
MAYHSGPESISGNGERDHHLTDSSAAMSEQNRRRPRAPRNSLSAELIVDTALRLLDERGIEGFSMRALAEELGVGTMALYTYFSGKDELFRAARERVFAQEPPPARTDAPWYEQLSDACLALYQLFTGRPSVLRLLAEQHRSEQPAEQAPVGGAVAMMEHMLGLLRGAGLGREEAARAQTALLQYTVGAALRADRARCAGAEGRRRFRERLETLSAEEFPLIVDLAPELADAQESAAQYAFGLALMLGGLRTAGSWGEAGLPPPYHC